ncbi:unnamed protein product, partial [Mesorhabditis belari]|uniref:Ground-like domain-containing protein n=1 Tax=Mesorhabditis belari TaxID=2138241 RepID=A0AAF3F2S8_9BILA
MFCPSCQGSPQYSQRFYPPPSPPYLSPSTYPIQQPQIPFPRQFYAKPAQSQQQQQHFSATYSPLRPLVQFNPMPQTYRMLEPILQPAQQPQYAQMYERNENENGAALQSVTEATLSKGQTNGVEQPDGESYDEEMLNRNDGGFSNPQTDSYESYESVEKSAVDEPNPQNGYKDDTFQNQQVRLPRTDTLTSEEKFELAMRKGAIDYEDGGLSEAMKPVKTKHSSLQKTSQFNDPSVKKNEIFADGLSILKEQMNNESFESLNLRSEGGGNKKKGQMTNEEMEIYDDLLGSSFGRSFEKDGESLSATTTSTHFSSPSYKEYALPSLRKPQKMKREHPSKCASDKLRSLMHQSMSSSPSTSKQLVYSAVRAAFDEKSPDVICSRSSFSYIVVTSPIYCEHRKAPVTCFVYFQP